MPAWAWVLVGLFGFLLVLALAWVVRILILARGGYKMRADVLDRGEDVAAWVVDVHTDRQLGGTTVLVLLSPDPGVPDDVMRGLAARLQDLRTRRRKPADHDERRAVRQARSGDENPLRTRLPDGFTGGWEVYSHFMYLMVEDEENLPKGTLEGEWFPARVIWDEYEQYTAVPPRRKKKSRR
jgi:hypothetical protein